LDGRQVFVCEVDVLSPKVALGDLIDVERAMQIKFFRKKGIKFFIGGLIDVKKISMTRSSLIDGLPLIIFWMVDRSFLQG